MKKITYLFILALFFVACQPTATDSTDVIPEDLAGKQKLLTEKRSELRELEKLINQLEEQVSELDTSEAKRKLITTIPVAKEDFKHFVEIQATITADDPIYASSEMGGRILSMKWKEGDFISKGQTVATLDMEQVNKQIAEIEKRKELAATTYERQKRLWEQNIGSEMQYLQAKNNLESLEKSLETIRFQLTKATVKAPTSGTVDMVMLSQGEMAGPGAPIISIINYNNVKVIADVPEIHLKDIKRGDKVEVNFPAIDLEKTARVTKIGKQINAANRTFEVEINMSNPKGDLKPNLQAILLLNDETVADAIIIPEELIRQEVSGQDYVFIVKNDAEKGNIAAKKYIKTGLTYEGMVAVEEGLEGAEILIDRGSRSISEDDYIEIKNPTTENISNEK